MVDWRSRWCELENDYQRQRTVLMRFVVGLAVYGIAVTVALVMKP